MNRRPFFRRYGALAVVAVSVLAAATAAEQYVSGARGWFLAGQLTVGVVACALVPTVLRKPVPAALALAALAALSPTATPPATLGTLHVAGTRRLPVAAAVAVAGIGAHTLRWVWLPLPGASFFWWFVLVVVAHTALFGWGAWASARRQLIASLHDRARRAEAEQERRVAEARVAERHRIAREMHDVLAHRLSLLTTYAGALEYRPDHPPERLSQAAGVIRAGAHQALEDLRDVIVVLREDDAGDEPARPLPTLADLPELIAECRNAGTPIELDDTIAGTAPVPGPVGRTAYRVLQEALTNARKHAPGRPVHIALSGTPGENLVIDVTNPLGEDAGTPLPGAGTGLIGLAERVRLAGGGLDHRVAGGTFRLHTWLPWSA